MGTGVRKPLRSVRYSRRKLASMKSCSLSSVRYSKGSAIARSGIARVDCSVHTVVYIQLYICYTVNLLAELLTLGLLGAEMLQ